LIVMDQIKPIIAVMAKHVFWAGCGLILIVSVSSWYVARGTLHDEFDKNLGDIDAKRKSVDSLMQKSQQTPPNEHSHKGMDGLLDDTLQKVVKAWDYQYSNQVNILQWSRELGDDFVAAVRPHRPIELKIDHPTPLEQKLSINFRGRYRNYVENLLPVLAQRVGTHWLPKSSGPGASGGGEFAMSDTGRVATAEKPPLIEWDAGDQGRLLATHFDWTETAPTTLQVLYAQEDLWILTALVDIIAEPNGKIESRHDAVVKTIQSLSIGRGVTGRSGQVMGLAASTGMSGDGAYGGNMSYGGESMSEGESSGTDMPVPGGGDYSSGEGGAGGMVLGGVGADPADGRYVDNDYAPLPASRVREAIRTRNPADAFLVVAKRMPIRLRLIVDERKLHRLLAECGNSKLPVEIRQVRLNRGDSAGGGGGHDMGGGGYGTDGGSSFGSSMGLGGGYGSGGGMGEPSFGDGMSGLGGPQEDVENRTQISTTTSHDVPVELYGIIYIYNPVDQELQDRLKERTQQGLTGLAQPDTSSQG